jgi:hypothetical protein
MLWTHDQRGRPAAELPANAAAYLRLYEAELRSRKDFTGGPPWAVFRTGLATARYRVVWADLARRLNAAALTEPGDRQQLPLNSCYVAALPTAPAAERVAAWLNCSWLRVLARIGAVPASSGFFRYNAQVVGQLPLPPTVTLDTRLSRLAHEGRAGADVQEELDAITAGHLELSAPAQQALRSALDESSAHRR